MSILDLEVSSDFSKIVSKFCQFLAIFRLFYGRSPFGTRIDLNGQKAQKMTNLLYRVLCTMCNRYGVNRHYDGGNYYVIKKRIGRFSENHYAPASL